MPHSWRRHCPWPRKYHQHNVDLVMSNCGKFHQNTSMQSGDRRENASQVQGRNHGWKVEGPRLGFQHRGACTRTRPKAELGVGCGRGSHPPSVTVRGITPGKFLENSDAKSCILVTTMLISGLPRTWNFLLFDNYSQEVGGPIHCWFPQPKSWGTSLPRFLRLLCLCQSAFGGIPTSS